MGAKIEGVWRDNKHAKCNKRRNLLTLSNAIYDGTEDISYIFTNIESVESWLFQQIYLYYLVVLVITVYTIFVAL